MSLIGWTNVVGYLTQAWKQTSGDPSGLTWNYHVMTLTLAR